MKKHFVVKASQNISTKKTFKVFASKGAKEDTQPVKAAYDFEDENEGRYERVDTKQVVDYDGFTTDYTLWHDLSDDTYFCVFGDRDIYGPDDSDRDYETDSYDAAMEWFDLYKGPGEDEDDDVYSSTDVSASAVPHSLEISQEDALAFLESIDPSELGEICYQYNTDASELDYLSYVISDEDLYALGYGGGITSCDDPNCNGQDCVEGATAEELQEKMKQYTDKQTKVGDQLDGLKNRATRGFGRKKVMSADAADYEDEIQEISQEFTSENTSINSTKLPAIFKLVKFEPNTINIDYGGGKFDNVADYLTQYDVINLVYDPYNRSAEHNKEVISTVRKAGGADTATCSNVLNVIKEPEVRQNVLNNMSKLVKSGGTIYITVYEGKGDGAEGPTKSGYQLNRKTADYLEEIQQVFPNAKRKGKLIVATNEKGAVAGSTDLVRDLEIPGLSDVFASDIINMDITEIYNLVADTLDPNAGDVGTIAGPIDWLPDDHFSIFQFDAGTIYVYIPEESGEVRFIDGETGEILAMAHSTQEVVRYVESINSGAQQMRDEYEGTYSTNAASEPEGEEIEAAYVPEPSLDPPEYDEPEQLEDGFEQIEIPFDCIIRLNEDGWDYEDETYDWAAGPDRNGSWYSEYGVFLGDKGTMVECIDDMLMTRLPEGSGRFRISGTAILVFNVSGIDKYSDFEGLDEDGDPSFNETYDTEYADSRFDIQQSTIEDFNYEPLK